MYNNSLLIVDDYVDWGLVLKQVISKGNVFKRIDLMHDGESALNYITQHEPDFIILDIILTKYDGLYILHYIKDKLVGYNPHIYVISVLDSRNINTYLTGNLIDFYSVKPVNPNVVLFHVKRILQSFKSTTSITQTIKNTQTTSSFNLKREIQDYLFQLGGVLTRISSKHTLTMLLVCMERNINIKNMTQIYSRLLIYQIVIITLWKEIYAHLLLGSKM